MDGGHRAVIFDKFQGVSSKVYPEGTHFLIPFVQTPIIFDVRMKPRSVPVMTPSKDLQTVTVTLRVLFRPDSEALPELYKALGLDYDERVLPSIVNEVLKAVVAQFDAGELITMRERVSKKIRDGLLARTKVFLIFFIAAFFAFVFSFFGRQMPSRAPQ